MAGLMLLPPAGVSADVTKEDAKSSWNHSRCGGLASLEALKLGDISGDGRADAVLLWECSSGAGGAQMHLLSYWIDGSLVKQRLLETPLPAAGRLKIKNGSVIVYGSDYSADDFQGMCCPTLEVKLTYGWTGRKLKLIDRVVL